LTFCNGRRKHERKEAERLQGILHTLDLRDVLCEEAVQAEQPSEGRNEKEEPSRLIGRRFHS